MAASTKLYTHGEAFSQCGSRHDENEDAFLIDDDIGLYVVCDGLGGHAHGEVASAIAARTMAETLRSSREVLERARAGGSLDETKALLVSSVVRAHQAVREKVAGDAGFHGMGTTVTAVLALDDRALFAHVGDSRLYHVHGDQASLITADHTVAADEARRGRIDAEDVLSHPERHILLRAVGTDPHVEVDSGELALADGDRLVLMSDGVSDPLDQELIGEVGVLAGNSARALVGRAVSAGTDDDATVLVVDVSANPPETLTPRASNRVHEEG